MSIRMRNATQSVIYTPVGVTKHKSTTARSNTVCQRLHPDWRMIPHLEIFGWTKKHQMLEQYLRTQIKNGNITDVYFSSENEYAEAEFRLKIPDNKFAGRPIVNTANGIVTILEKYEAEISSPPYIVENVLGR